MFRSRFIRVVVPLCLFLSINNIGMAKGNSGNHFGPVNVAASRHSYTGTGCPVNIVFTGTINFRMPHDAFEFSYYWKRSDGAMSQKQSVSVPKNQRSMVVRDDWSLGSKGTKYNAWEALCVSTGNTRVTKKSPVVRIICK